MIWLVDTPIVGLGLFMGASLLAHLTYWVQLRFDKYLTGKHIPIVLFVKKYTLKRKIVRAGKNDEESTPVDSKVESQTLSKDVEEKEETVVHASDVENRRPENTSRSHAPLWK